MRREGSGRSDLWKWVGVSALAGCFAVACLVTSWDTLGWGLVAGIGVAAMGGAFLTIPIFILWTGQDSDYVTEGALEQDDTLTGDETSRNSFAQCLVWSMLDRDREVQEECLPYFWDVFDALKGAGFAVGDVFDGNALQRAQDALRREERPRPELRLLDRRDVSGMTLTNGETLQVSYEITDDTERPRPNPRLLDRP